MAVRDVTKGAKASSEAAALKVVESIASKIGGDELREPRVPTKNLIAEGRRIEGRVKKDLAILLKTSKFRRDDLFVLQALISLFETAATELFAATSPTLPSKVAKDRAAAESLLSIIWNDLQYVGDENEDEDLLRKVSELRQGDSLDDTIEDLTNTIPLVKKYAKALKDSGTTTAQEWLKRLGAHRTVLSAEQADSGVQDDYSGVKERRDRLGLVLESHLARLRHHGKKAFSTQPAKAGLYIDMYQATNRAKMRGLHVEPS